VSDDVEVVQLEDRADWRDWLERNHETSPAVWLVTWKKPTGKPRVDYDAAVEEALCFGWVDSKSRSVDDERTSLYFTPRKPKSAWSDSNVARVEELEAAGRMRAAGRRVVEEAKAPRNLAFVSKTATVRSGPGLICGASRIGATLMSRRAMGRPVRFQLSFLLRRFRAV
jgi:uncharacterized protein YdeI (YjbR/CyaY-like superfamily)